jgi:hypothetical protein
VGYTAGQKLRASQLGTSGFLPLGILAWANRPTNSTTTTTVEIGVLRLDSIPIVNGRSYRIWTSPMFGLSTTTGDVVAIRARGNTAGSAVVGSTIIGNQLDLVTNNTQPASGSMNQLYNSATTGSLSVIITVQRATGAGTVSIFGGFDLMVEDIGITVGDTGVDL